jgi:hypothetical protein
MPLNISGNVVNSDIVKTFSYKNIITRGLYLHLDAGAPESYPGSGTVWYDMSGNSRNFNIIAGAYNSSGPQYMDFNGSYGMAKNAADFPGFSDANGVTYVLWTRVKNANADWRTLTRAYTSGAGNHHVIIQSGGWNIGMYDNTNATGFNNTGYSQQSLPNYGTSNWICMYFRWQTVSPYYEFSYNDTPGTIRGSLTSANARHQIGFGSIGGYNSESTDPSVGSQFWGDISSFMLYNRRLTDAELLQIYNVQKGRYGL